jgi:hypothetical protein
MTKIRTNFDPKVNGFHFTNRFDGGAVVAELARQDRLSELTGLKVPKAAQDLADLASGASFWGTFGLCGGMSSTALEWFKQGDPIPVTHTIPNRDSELFRELVRRQADSLQGRTVLERCMVWQLLPDRAPAWMFWIKGVGKLTTQGEWPKLRAALETGTPTLLVLLRNHGVASPAKNHQVVAVGFDIMSGGGVVVHIYDPNHPGSSPTFALDVRNQTVGPKQSTGEPVRGFFL